MTTTVTVDDATRRRLKRLAAALDITQSEIIRRSLDLLEARILAGRRRKVPRRVEQALAEASKRVRAADPEWDRISSVIEQSPVSIEEFVSRAWGKELEG